MTGAATRIRVAICLVVVGAGCIASQAWATPVTVPGWPVGAPSGSVHERAGGGATVIAETIAGLEDPLTGVFAFDRRGRLVWRRLVGCIRGVDCAWPSHPPGLRSDGTYGPIVAAKAPISIGRAGRIVRPACGAAVLADRTCLTVSLPTTSGVAVTATRDGRPLWRHFEPGPVSGVEPDAERPPPVFVDDAGMAYLALGGGSSPGEGRIVALDGGTGAVRWRTPAADAVAALGRGVLALTAADLVAYAPDGTVVWARPRSTLGLTVSVVSSDPPRGQVLLEQSVGAGRIVALDHATGQERWRFAGHGPLGARSLGAILGIGSTGTVYVAGARGGYGLIALDSGGRRLWRYPTVTPVVGAMELPDGTVVLSTEGPSIESMQGLLTRIDPRRRAPMSTRARVSLSRRTVLMNCADGVSCIDETRDGAILRLDFPRATPIRLRVRSATGGPPDRRNPPGFRRALDVWAPRGTSFVRVLDFGNSGGETIDPFGTGDGIVRPGRYILEVSWRSGAARVTRTLPVTVRVTRRGAALPGID